MSYISYSGQVAGCGGDALIGAFHESGDKRKGQFGNRRGNPLDMDVLNPIDI
jgi:hypothetical protein